MRAGTHRHGRLSRAVAAGGTRALRRRSRGRGGRRSGARSSASYPPERLRELVAKRRQRRRLSACTPSGSGRCATRGFWRLLPAVRAGAAARRRRSCGASATRGWKRPRRWSSAREGLPVRLPDVRPLRAHLDRHVLPDELPEVDAQRPVRRRAAGRALRGQARDALRLGAGLRGLAPDGRRATGSTMLQPPVDHRLAGRSAWLAPRARARGRVIAADRPAGRARRSAAATAGPQLARPARAGAAGRAVRRHLRAQPARFRRPARGLRAGAGAVRGVRRDQRRRRLGRPRPHVERRHLRAADPRRLRARPADRLPRPQPDRDPGRRAGCRRHGRAEHPVPHRRRRAVRRPAGGQAGVRPRQHLAARRPSAPCATRAGSSPAAS